MSMIHFVSRTCVVTSLLFAMAAIGCSGDNDSADRDVRTALETGNARGQQLAAQAGTELAGNSAQAATQKIASILHTINDGEIMQANAVLGGTNSSQARGFADRMIRDHQLANARLDALLQTLQLSPQDNPISAALRDEVAASIADLQQVPSSEVAYMYLQMQIQMHQEAFVLVGSLRGIATDERLDRFVRDTRGLIAQHRDDAAHRLRHVRR